MLNTSLEFYNPAALDAALIAALPGKIDSISTFGPNVPIRLYLAGQTAPLTANDETTAQAVFDAHDPVFISIDKLAIQANGTDTATVTITAPNASPAPIILMVSLATVPVTLTNGIGKVTITSNAPTTIPISVQNGANRCVDVLTLLAN